MDAVERKIFDHEHEQLKLFKAMAKEDVILKQVFFIYLGLRISDDIRVQ
jgi:hypothetical protein